MRAVNYSDGRASIDLSRSILIFFCHDFIEQLSDGHRTHSWPIMEIMEDFSSWNERGRTIYIYFPDHKAEGCKLGSAFVDVVSLRSTSLAARCRKEGQK